MAHKAKISSCILLIAWIPVSHSSDYNVINGVKSLSTSSADLAKKTNSIAASVAGVFQTNKAQQEAASEKRYQSEFDKAYEIRKMTEDVSQLTDKANKAQAEAATKVAKLQGDAMQATLEAQNEVERVKVQAKLDTTKATAEGGQALAAEKTVLQLRIGHAEKQAAELNTQVSQINAKAAKDVADTFSFGSTNMRGLIAKKKQVAEAEATSAASNAMTEEAALHAVSTEAIQKDLAAAQKDSKTAQAMMATMEQWLTQGKKDVSNILLKEFDMLKMSKHFPRDMRNVKE